MSEKRWAQLSISMQGIFPVIGFFSALWIVLVIIANPAGNFPLNDDWNYGRSVHGLLTEHKWLVTNWSLTASVTHSLIGYLVCLPFGFSFNWLRGSSIVLAFIAVICCYLLCRQTGAARLVALIGALVLMVNPLFFNLALTFMTDVPFLGIAGVALVLLSEILCKRRAGVAVGAKEVVLATLVTAAACLTRQVALVVPVAFMAAYFVCKPLAVAAGDADATAAARAPQAASDWLPRVTAVLPLLVSAGLVLVFQVWLYKEFGVLRSYRAEEAYLKLRFEGGPLFGLRAAAVSYMQAFIYLGLFALPLMPMVLRSFLEKLEKRERNFALALAIEVGLLMSIGLIYTGSAMPLVDNVFFNFGLGPLLVGLIDVVKPSWPEASIWAMLALSCAGAIGAGFLLAIFGPMLVRLRARRRLFQLPSASATVTFCGFTLAAFLFVVCMRGLFDRYLLFALMLLLPCLCAATQLVSSEKTDSESPGTTKPTAVDNRAKSSMVRVALSCALLFPFIVFAVAGTHDYLSWNRARWQALDALTRSVSPLEIDGGLEFNGWYGYDLRFRAKQTADISMVHGRRYAVTFDRVPGYEIQSRYPFERWLPPGKGEILVLKQVVPPSPPSAR